MSNPTKYEPSYSFSGFQEANPSRPLPAQRVDVEFQNVARTTGELIAALGDVRRSDGRLVNGIVTLEALSDDVQGRLGGGSGGGGPLPDLSAYQLLAAKGRADGYAPLGSTGQVPVVNLPSASANAAGIVRVTDNLTSTAGGVALSANQGRVLAAAKADKATTIAGYEIRDAYTKVEVNQLIADVEAAAGDGSGETGASILSKLLTVDGAGSGLDADTLDGHTAEDFVLQTVLPAQLEAPRYYTKDEATNLTKLFERPDVAAATRAAAVVDSKLPFNENTGRQMVGEALRVEAEGSVRNGPGPASVGKTISIYKEGFGTGSAKGGEIDALYVVLRQDSPRDGSLDINSPTRGDGCGVLIDAAVYENVGFVGGIEGATTVLRNDGQGQSKRQGYQIGVTDTTTGASMGFFTGATIGQHGTGVHVHASEAEGGYYSSPFYYGTERGKIFSVERDGTVSLGKRLANGDLLQNAMHLVVQSDYSFGIANADKSAQLLNLSQAGVLNVLGGVFAPNLPTVERGTWTPVLQGSGGSAVGSYSAFGTWAKVGPLVTFAISWSISSPGAANGQHLQVTNMPFPRSEMFDAGVGRLLAPANEAGYMITANGGTANSRLLNISRYDAAMLVKSGGSGRVGGTFVTAE